jgi:hypothetical protein
MLFGIWSTIAGMVNTAYRLFGILRAMIPSGRLASFATSTTAKYSKLPLVKKS